MLTEIDVTATFRAKLGEQIEDYTVLGACDPPSAYRVLGIDRSIGPLPAVQRRRPRHRGRRRRGGARPAGHVTLTGRPELKPVADEVARRLASALAALTS